MTTSPVSAPAPPSAPRLEWVDRIKGLAMIWIFLNHAVERLLGGAHFSNPTPLWPPLAERISQLRPVEGYGVWGIFLNLFRYAGWTGEQGVQLFLLASGFGLTWSLLQAGKSEPPPLKEFYVRRLLRLFPLWWAVHGIVILLWILGEAYIGKTFLLSLAGLRCTPNTFYAISPSWWFFGLLVQIYLCFPFLWKALRRWGPWSLLAASLAACILLRGYGILRLTSAMEMWLRGVFILTRLPEFVLGMVLAHVLKTAPQETDARLRSPGGIAAAFGIYLLGTVLGMTWSGMTISPFLLGAGAFGLCYPLLAGPCRFFGSALSWIGLHSYSIFLVHHPIVEALLPAEPPRMTAGITARLLLAAALSLPAGVILEMAVAAASSGVNGWMMRRGFRGVLFRCAALLTVVVLALLGGELLARRVAPAELLGWGERPSLEPDDRFGWKLRPSQTTRLRWESYDYVITANSLGFPGPEVPTAKSPGVLRILTTGDAFTSAEGVDTPQAWPRRLESRLAELRAGRNVEVLNFAVTAYGPNQYARVVREFAPRYRPDLILVELYVNEFEDVLMSDEQFRGSINFGGPHPDGLRSVLGLENLRSWIHLHGVVPLLSRLKGEPDPNAVFLRGVSYLERSRNEWWTRGRDELEDRLSQIKSVADGIGAKVWIVMVPSAVQVCGPEQLALFPHPLNLNDRDRFDLDLPQRLAREIADRRAMPFIDLRTLLRQANPCAYQQRNMHWTVSGHQIVADHLAGKISGDPEFAPR